MIRSIILLTFIGSGAAAQCPEPILGGGAYSATGPGLIAPQSWPVSAQGDIEVPCADWLQQGVQPDQIDGFLPTRPTAVIELEEMGPHILMVMAEAQCSPRLAVRTLDGLWHFGTQANGRQEVTIWGAPDGPLQVWLGTEAQDECEAMLTLETFDR